MKTRIVQRGALGVRLITTQVRDMFMLSAIRNFFKPQQPTLAAAVTEHSAKDESSAFDVGLHDAMLSGWFNPANNELYPSFSVTAEDVVLDVGCGDGGNANYCAMRGAEIILADIDEQKIQDAVKRLEQTPARSVTSHVTDSSPIPLADATATRVVCTEVIEHVDNPEAFVAELVRVGQPGSLYLLSVPHPSSEDLQRTIAAPAYFEKPNHIRVLSEEQFKTLVSQSGLEIISHSKYGFYWSLWMLMFWDAGATSFENPNHPMLSNWQKTWQEVLKAPRGAEIKALLDQVIAKSQVIVARKPV